MAKINITQVRSRIGSTQLQRRNLDALGLRKINKTVQHEDSPIIMGMLEKVRHLVKIEMNAAPIEKAAAKTAAPKAKKEVKAEAPVEKAETAEATAAEKKPAAKAATGESKPAAKKPAAAKTAKPAAEKKPAAKKSNE